ncbi:hypothetical protein [Streptomyces sp. NPDC005408]
MVRDALGENGRFGQIEALHDQIVSDLGTLLGTVTQNLGDGSPP